jgi:hypothetical protein
MDVVNGAGGLLQLWSLLAVVNDGRWSMCVESWDLAR